MVRVCEVGWETTMALAYRQAESKWGNSGVNTILSNKDKVTFNGKPLLELQRGSYGEPSLLIPWRETLPKLCWKIVTEYIYIIPRWLSISSRSGFFQADNMAFVSLGQPPMYKMVTTLNFSQALHKNTEPDDVALVSSLSFLFGDVFSIFFCFLLLRSPSDFITLLGVIWLQKYYFL